MEPLRADLLPSAHLAVISHLWEANLLNTLSGIISFSFGVNSILSRAMQLSFFTGHWHYTTLISSLKTKLNPDEHTDLVGIFDFLELYGSFE